MNSQSRIPALVAVVVSAVACLPTACCLGFYAFGSFVVLMADPRMIQAAAGTGGEVPPRSTIVVAGLGLTVGTVVALAIGIGLLVWGIRALRRARSAQVEGTAV